MRTVLATLSMLAAGCYASHELEPRDCPPAPAYFFRHDDPPRGRIAACDACVITEDLCGRRLPCTLTGACDYAKLVERWEAGDCEYSDPCTRPDPRFYWRPEGD